MYLLNAAYCTTHSLTVLYNRQSRPLIPLELPQLICVTKHLTPVCNPVPKNLQRILPHHHMHKVEKGDKMHKSDEDVKEILLHSPHVI